MDDAAELLQMGLRMRALAVGRIEEQRCRRPRAAEWPLVANVEPALAKAGVHSRPVLVLPVPGASTGRGVVDMQSVAGQDVDGEGIRHRLQRRRRGANPTRQGRGLQAHRVASEHLGLTIERQMIVVL
jgi:hypothetical protein